MSSMSITTPLGGDVLLLRSFVGSEGISQLFQFDLDLVSEKQSIVFDSIVGKNVTLSVALADGSARHWNGFVSRFSQGAQDGSFTTYRAELSPWLWFLTRTADCRIFQNRTAPDIIKTVFEDLGFTDFSFRLQGAFVERDYCVQYRETDFNFVSRLMEEEGMYYFFEHSEGTHKLIVANDPGAHAHCPGQATVRYDMTAGGWQDADIVTSWMARQEFRPGSWAHTDYNFETPGTSLMSKATGKNKYEIYDYPGEYQKRGEGDKLARIRLEEQTAPGFVLQGASNCRAFTSGYKFDLTNHYRTDLNQTYLLTAVQHSGSLVNKEPVYANTVESIPAKTVFRPARTTPQPVVQGCQSAVVVGPRGEEIHTDKYGRVKIQFHWDREGKLNENSSSWVRVSSPWAGKGWGELNIPRIGQEVIVDFLEGDPDRPIIIGRVYNAQQLPPFALPGGAAVSGVKSNSTKGGGGYNEISLNDAKGTELIRIHAQYDMEASIGHDDRVDIGNNRAVAVNMDESTTIGGNRTQKVGKNESITVGGNRTESVGGKESITIASGRTENIGASESVTIGTNQALVIGKNLSESIGENRSASVGKDDVLNVGRNLVIDAGDSIMIKTGDAAISMKKDGTITIKGKDIVIQASGNISQKADGDIIMKGRKIRQN